MPQKCPKCGSSQFFYHERVYITHYINEMPLDNYCDLHSVAETRTDDHYQSFIRCDNCGTEYDLTGKEQN